MCKPSELPGGVSSFADADALAEADADWEADTESLTEGG